MSLNFAGEDPTFEIGYDNIDELRALSGMLGVGLDDLKNALKLNLSFLDPSVIPEDENTRRLIILNIKLAAMV